MGDDYFVQTRIISRQHGTKKRLVDSVAGVSGIAAGRCFSLRQLRAGTWRDPGTSTVDLLVARDPDEKYELSADDEDALEESIAQIERGECVTAETLLSELRAMRVRHG